MNASEGIDTAPASTDGNYITIIADIVSAYVSNNSLRPADLPELIATVHDTIRKLTSTEVEAPPSVPLVPAVPIKRSLTNEFIICLEDGKKFRSLKRHLGSVYKMTPDEYRQKWGLASDYPMVAPGYSEVRSRLAKDIGLGQQRSVEVPAKTEDTKLGETKRTAGRPKKVARSA